MTAEPRYQIAIQRRFWNYGRICRYRVVVYDTTLLKFSTSPDPLDTYQFVAWFESGSEKEVVALAQAWIARHQ